jgi:hypothetical protein
MPTIYDILPTLEEESLKLLQDFMKADGGAFHTWEIAIFIPASNAYLHYLSGVNESLKNDNYMSAMANVRGLIEALGAIVYDGTARLPKEAYDWFLEKGRLPKRNKKDTKWIALRPTEAVAYAQSAVDPKIKLDEIYAACCDMLHFSNKHMSFLGGFNPQLDEDSRFVTLKIGTKDDIPAAQQREMIDFCALITNVFGECIRLAIKEKSQRNAKK